MRPRKSDEIFGGAKGNAFRRKLLEASKTMNKEVLDRMKTRLINKGGLNKELVGIVGRAESDEEIEEDFVDKQGSQK